MILLAAVGLALVGSLLCGGSLASLAELRLRHGYLIFVSLGIQILVFSPVWQNAIRSTALSEVLYALSLLLLLVAVWLNRRLPGMAVLGAGLLSNALVILVNGGHMPASLAALQSAGLVDSRASFEAARVTNSSLIEPGTPLWFLGDVWAIPARFPLANVFSVGDVAIAAGGALLIVRGTRPRQGAEAP